jgi:hypothetical protein
VPPFPGPVGPPNQPGGWGGPPPSYGGWGSGGIFGGLPGGGAGGGIGIGLGSGSNSGSGGDIWAGGGVNGNGVGLDAGGDWIWNEGNTSKGDGTAALGICFYYNSKDRHSPTGGLGVNIGVRIKW